MSLCDNCINKYCNHECEECTAAIIASPEMIDCMCMAFEVEVTGCEYFTPKEKPAPVGAGTSEEK